MYCTCQIIDPWKLNCFSWAVINKLLKISTPVKFKSSMQRSKVASKQKSSTGWGAEAHADSNVNFQLSSEDCGFCQVLSSVTSPADLQAIFFTRPDVSGVNNFSPPCPLSFHLHLQTFRDFLSILQRRGYRCTQCASHPS